MKTLYEFNDKFNEPYKVFVIDSDSYPIDGINDPYLRSFFLIYQGTFEGNKENIEVICDRLKYNSNPNTYLAICLSRTDNTVIGGYILEYYSASKFCLLTYIFIQQDYQNRLIGIELGKSLQKLVNTVLIEKENKIVKTVLFEMAAHQDYAAISKYAPAARFFSKIEGVWIDIPYLEPLTNNEKYILGAIPIAGNLRENITKNDLSRYLTELYNLTDQTILTSDFYKQVISSSLDEQKSGQKKITDKIKEFPKLVQPQLHLSKISIAFHLIQESGISVNWGELKKRNYIYCNVFNSFEKDLFSQRFVEDPPYYSKHVDVQYATIQFSNVLSFNSEGREETLILVDENKKPLEVSHLEKKVKVFLNYTLFKDKTEDTNKLVWEIVLSPVDYFNEYEIIQLQKYYTGKQESFTINIRYFYNKKECTDLFDLAETLIGNDVVLRKEVLAGTVQLDTSQLTYYGEQYLNDNPDVEKTTWNWNEIYQYYNADINSKKTEHGADKLENIYKKYPDAKYILNTFCGIALGIFDFARMSIEEVEDTLVPLRQTDSYFLILNKSSIACFCDDNDIYANALKYGIGINPYLIIPNSVLAYNSYLTIAVNDEIDRISKKTVPSISDSSIFHIVKNKLINIFSKSSSGYNPDKLAELQSQRDHISNYLKNEVPNVFQYETERELYNHGMDKRGVTEKGKDLERKVAEINDAISHLRDERDSLFGRLSIILGIISLSQIYQVFDMLNQLIIKKEGIEYRDLTPLFITILSLILFYYFFKNYLKKVFIKIN